MPNGYVSFGSTMLNLGTTGRPTRGLKQGTYCLMVGDSNSGKTFLSLAVLAEASIDPEFDEYDLVYDGPEFGAQMDLTKMYGKKAGERIQILDPPSTTVQEFYDRVDQAQAEGKKEIRILDSMDALIAEEDEEQVDKERKAREAGKEAKGSYGMAKAKVNSGRLRVIVNRLARTGSILIIISQTRDNIGYGAMFNPKTRSGGKALKFYAAVEIWTAFRESLKKKYKGKDVEKGMVCFAKVKRTRHTGRSAEVNIPILHETGVDDVGSMVDYLVEWSHWSFAKGIVTAPEFEFKGQADKLCSKIDADPKLTNKLKKIVWAVWKNVEESTKLDRRNKYHD